ncbi:MAG: M48 family metalloprotease [Candidatus Izemoplasmataceae bacterium]
MIIRFIIITTVFLILGFNTVLDALNMGTSNTKNHRNKFLKQAIIRFIFSMYLVYSFLVSEFTPTSYDVIILILGITLIFITEFLFIKRRNFFSKIKVFLKLLINKYILLLILPLVIMSLLVYWTSFTVYALTLVGLILFLGILYSLIYHVFIHKLVHLVPYNMVFESDLYELENSLNKDLYIVQSDKLNLPMNALFMGLFKMKRVLLTPKIVAYLTSEEVKAIIYHELGHYHHNHLRKRLMIVLLIILMYLAIGIAFFTLPILSFIGLPYTLFNLTLMIGISVYLSETVIESYMIHQMHQQEYEADSYVKKHFKASKLISALKKIKSIEHEIQLDPLYQRLKVSHPSIKSRVKKLKG